VSGAEVELFAVRRFPWERLIRRIQFPSRFKACKLVGLTLATYADADGQNVRPGQQRLMDDCQLSERTVRDALTFLREHHLIYRRSRGSSFGTANMVDLYQLSCPDDWRTRFSYLGDPQVEPWREQREAA